tara:strand:+ start:12344 stop:12805 length:462 start_codon:yes stop_codon:yes gene_type:complete
MKTKIITIFMVLLISLFIVGCKEESETLEEEDTLGMALQEGDLDVTPENLDTYVDFFDEWEYDEVDQDTLGSMTFLTFDMLYDTEGATYEEVEEITEGYFTDWEDWTLDSGVASEHAKTYRKDFEEEGYAILYRTYHVESANNLFVSVEFHSL